MPLCFPYVFYCSMFILFPMPTFAFVLSWFIRSHNPLSVLIVYQSFTHSLSPLFLSCFTFVLFLLGVDYGPQGFCQAPLSRHLYTGGRGHLSSGYMVSSLWVLKQLAHPIFTGYRVNTFGKSSAQCPVGTLWKKPLTSFTIHSKQYPSGTLWKKPLCSSQFTLQSIQWLLCERNPWVLSQFTSQYAHQEPEPLIKSSFKNTPLMGSQHSQ